MAKKRSYDTLIGGSVGWNQLVRIPVYSVSQTVNGITLTDHRDGTYTINGTSTASCAFIFEYVPTIKGHKYYVKALNEQTESDNFWFGLAGIKIDKGKGGIWNNTLDYSQLGMRFDAYQNATINNITIVPQIIDLTLLLGSTIADYLYSLESSTSGAGIAKLREWGFDLDTYHAYDAGSIKSVEASAKVTRDASDNIIGNYPLDSSLTLRGIPKLTDGKLWYDGDRYEADGTVTRRFGVVDLGTLNWERRLVSATNIYYFVAHAPGIKLGTQLICSKYMQTEYAPNNTNMPDKSIYNKLFFSYQDNIIVRDDSYTDDESFKTAMSGVMLIYELATPTTETADPFTNPQIVDPDGTEEYVSSGVVPVGHETRYQL